MRATPLLGSPRALLALMVAWLVIAAGVAAAAPEVDLSSVGPDRDLAKEMLVLDAVDRRGAVGPELVSAPGWRAVVEHPELLVAPRRHSAVWLQVRLHNASSAPLTRWLEIAPWRLKRVEAWLLDVDTGAVRERILIGSEAPPQSHAESRFGNRLLVPVSLAADERVRVLLHVESDSRPFLSVFSWDPVAFTAREVSRYQTHSILLAAILTLAVVLTLALNLRYLLVSLWILAMFVTQAEKEGYISFLLFDGLSDYANHLRFTSTALVLALFMMVSVYLLGLQRHAAWRWVPPVSVATVVIYAGLTFVLDGVALRKLIVALHLSALMVWPLMLPAAWRMQLKWQPALIALLVVSWGVFLFYALSYTFNIRYTARFAEARTMLDAAVVIGLLLVYTLQKKDYERSLKRQLRKKEQIERALLEKVVEERTRELNEALERAKKADAAKTDFLSRVTHDLKSPLTAIIGYAQLLRVEQGRTGQMSGIIHNSAAHMLRLVSRLIDYARDATRAEAHPTNLYLPAFIEDVGHEARILADMNRNEFRMQASPSLCAVIRCDQTFLREVLLNILDNAAKHTCDGVISLSVACTPETEPGRATLTCAIEDNGAGMTTEQAQRVFDPFYRVSDKGEGLGLGMSIVKELVARMGGHITLRSEPGAGTLVELCVPVEVGQETPCFAVIKQPSHMLPQYDADGRPAWIVEDAPAIRDLLIMELDALNFEVRSFADAESALAELNAATRLPAIIITDHSLPGKSGSAVLEAARKRDSSLPVILLSATASLFQTETDSEGDTYSTCLSKPVDLILLRNEIAACCNLTPQSPDAQAAPATTDDSETTAVDSLDSETLERLEHWIALGALTDILDWCDANIAGNQEGAGGIAIQLRRLAEQGDFGAMRERLGSLLLRMPATANRH